MNDLWNHREGESDKAYRAFSLYLSLPPTYRSIIAAYRLYSGKETAKNTPGWFGDWSSRYAWVERAKAFDVHCAEEAIKSVSLRQKQVLSVSYDLLLSALHKQKVELPTMRTADVNSLINSLQKLIAAYHSAAGEAEEIPSPDDEPDMIEVAPTPQSNGELRQ